MKKICLIFAYVVVPLTRAYSPQLTAKFQHERSLSSPLVDRIHALSLSRAHTSVSVECVIVFACVIICNVIEQTLPCRVKQK